MKYFPPLAAGIIVSVLAAPLPVFAAFNTENSLELVMGSVALKLVFFGFALTMLFLFVALIITDKSDIIKRTLFDLIIISVTVPTVVLVYNTVFLNANSWSNGPVHWHADYEVWACGQQLDLVDPTGWSNKIGTATLHEHSDNRIHIEGVAITPGDVSLGRFIAVAGGEITNSALIFPDKNGLLTVTNGAVCRDGTVGTVQAYVYRMNPDNTFVQKKLHTPGSYVPSPQSQVPPGDCLIIEFGPESPRTNRLCRSWHVAQSTGKLKGERIDNAN